MGSPRVQGSRRVCPRVSSAPTPAHPALPHDAGWVFNLSRIPAEKIDPAPAHGAGSISTLYVLKREDYSPRDVNHLVAVHNLHASARLTGAVLGCRAPSAFSWSSRRCQPSQVVYLMPLESR